MGYILLSVVNFSLSDPQLIYFFLPRLNQDNYIIKDLLTFQMDFNKI